MNISLSTRIMTKCSLNIVFFRICEARTHGFSLCSLNVDVRTPARRVGHQRGGRTDIWEKSRILRKGGCDELTDMGDRCNGSHTGKEFPSLKKIIQCATKRCILLALSLFFGKFKHFCCIHFLQHLQGNNSPNILYI